MPLYNVRCVVCSSVEEELLRSDEVPPRCTALLPAKDGQAPDILCGGERARTMEGYTFYVAGQLMVDNPYGEGLVREQDAKEMVSARTGTPVKNLSVQAFADGNKWDEKADKLRQESLDSYKKRGVADEKALQELREDGKAKMQESTHVTVP